MDGDPRRTLRTAFETAVPALQQRGGGPSGPETGIARKPEIGPVRPDKGPPNFAIYPQGRRNVETAYDASGLRLISASDRGPLTLQSRKIHSSYTEELKLLQPYSPQVALGTNQVAPYLEVRGLVESTDGGCYGFVSEGTLTKTVIPAVPVAQEAVTDQRTFEGWRRL